MEVDLNSSKPSLENNNFSNSLVLPKKNNPLLIIIAILLVAILAVGIFIALEILQQKNSTIVNNAPKLDSKGAIKLTEEDKKKAQDYAATIKRVVYVKDNSVMVINSDGTGASRVTDSEPNSSFLGLAWKNKSDVSYIKCLKSCAIYTKDALSATPTKEILEANPGESAGDTEIFALSWNHAGNQLAYIYKLPDGQMRMDFKSGAIKNVVKTFASLTAGQGGRGGSLDDNVSIFFSPDDKFVLVTNTLGQPTVNDKSTVWVFDVEGKEILNIKSDSNSWATQAFWNSESSFIYKQGDGLYIQHLGTDVAKLFQAMVGGSEVTINTSPYNPIAFSDKFYYWSTKNSISPMILEGTAGSKYQNVLIQNAIKPQSLPPNFLVAIKTQEIKGKESMLPFESVGLMRINLVNRDRLDLDSGDINLFTISP